MKKYRFPWQADIDSDHGVEIESLLESSLNPVNPRSDYIHELRERLNRVTPRPKFILPKRFQYIILGIAGFISGVVLLLTGIRAITTFLATMGMIRQINRERRKKQLQESSVAT